MWSTFELVVGLFHYVSIMFSDPYEIHLLRRRGTNCKNHAVPKGLAGCIDTATTHVDIMLSPAFAIALMAINCADWPLDAATAAAPPSSAAIRFSKMSCQTQVSTQPPSSVRRRTTVGLPIRE